MSGGILSLPDEKLHILELKHPDANGISQQAILQGPIKRCFILCINKRRFLQSGLDIGVLQRIIVSSCFRTATSDLYKAIAELV